MAEELKVNIIGDASQLKGALGQAGGQVDGFAAKIGKVGKTMTVVGGVIVAALGAIVMKTAAVGDKFDKMSLRTGVAVEDLSALAYAADISGTSIETMEKGLKGLTKTMDDASRGIGEGLEAFEELDIAVTDTEGNLRSTVEILKEAATKISAIENPTKQAAYAMDLFGAKAGPQLLPLLKMGESGIDDLMKKAGELGITLSTESASAAAEFTDRLTDLKGSLAGVGRDIAFVLMPPLTRLAEKVIEIIKKIKTWVDSHKPLVEMIVKVGAVLGAIALVGGPILMAISVIGKLKTAIVAVGVAIKAVTVAMAANPLGLAILAAAALYAAWVTNFAGIRDFTLAVVEGIKKALGWLWDKVLWLGEKLGLFKRDVTEDFNEMNQEITISAEGVAEAAGKAATAIDDEATAAGEAIEPVDTFATSNKTLADNLGEVADKAKEATEQIKVYAEDVAENYIALSIKATDSWEDFYAFWEAEAERSGAAIVNAVEEVAAKIDNTIQKIENAAGEITGVILPGGGVISTEPITAPSVGPDYYEKKNNNNRTYSPTVQVTVQGDGDAAKIKQAVEQALDESARQYSRSGNTIPGMA